MKLTTALIIFMLLFQKCGNYKKEKYLFLNSKNKDSLIRGTYLLKETDTYYIREIFENPYMPGVTFRGEFYGKSVYVARMEMLQKISNLKSPNEITDNPDSVIINFYRQWAMQSGYLKK